MRLAIACAALPLLLLADPALATQKMAVKEDLGCTSCHSDASLKRLTDQGKFYELMGTLDGYADIKASFGNCTFCHRRKPGSKKLTKAGKGFANALGGMEALVEWMQDRHPGWPEPSDDVEIEAPPEKTGAAADGEPRPVPAH